MKFSSSDLSVPDALYAVLNLEEASKQKLNAVFEETFAEIREWERTSAVIQEHSDDRVVYQIPASDLKFAEKLGASLEGVLSEDDHELVTAAFDGSFKNLGKPREISLDLLEHHNPELIKYTVEVSEIAGGKNRWVRHKITGNYPRNSPIEFDRWSHLFEVE